MLSPSLSVATSQLNRTAVHRSRAASIRRTASVAILLGLALAPGAAGDHEAIPQSTAPALTTLVAEVEQALAEADSERSRARLEALRAYGPAAVEALIDRLDLAPPADRPESDLAPSSLTRAAGDLLDRVCAQRDCASSRLFWHTDLGAALTAAEATGRPILSLRLLGRLDEELSCANSRYFRALLYADPEIAARLRHGFVLHWQSIRPVPKVTVELSNGRRLERTLTGNSVHYVLDRRGRLVDALPGLYAPAAFGRLVDELGDAARTAGELDDARFAAWRDRRAAALVRSISQDRDRQLEGMDAATLPFAGNLRDERTMTKAATVNPVLTALLPTSRPGGPWTRLADLYREDARLSPQARWRVARMQDLAAFAAAEGAPPLDLLIQRLAFTLEADLAADTALNQFYLRPALLQGIVDGYADLPPGELDRWVYTAIFGDPGDDPWLGLAPADAFAALPGGGRSLSR